MFFLYTGAVFATIGVLALSMPHRMSVFFATAAWALYSPARADHIARTQSPLMLRILGAPFSLMGVFLGSRAFVDPPMPHTPYQDAVLLAVGVVIAICGVLIFLARRAITGFAARRIRRADDLFSPYDIDTSAKWVVRLLGTWFLVVSFIPIAFVLTR